MLEAYKSNVPILLSPALLRTRSKFGQKVKLAFIESEGTKNTSVNQLYINFIMRKVLLFTRSTIKNELH